MGSSIATVGQLSFGRDEDMSAYLGARTQHATQNNKSQDPVTAADPDGVSGRVLKCEVDNSVASSNTQWSRLAFRMNAKPTTITPLDEIWCEFEVYQANPTRVFIQTWFRFLTAGSATLVWLADITSASQLRSFDGNTVSFSSSTTLQAWNKIKIHYSKSTTGSDGILKIWIGGFVVIDITDHGVTDQFEQFDFGSKQESTLAGTAQDNSVYYRKFAWGPTEADAAWTDASLSFGCAHSSTSTANIDVVLHLDIDPVHATAAEITAAGTAGDAFLIWEYKKSASGTWLIFSSDDSQPPDAFGDHVFTKTIIGLDENTSYDFRASVDGTNTVGPAASEETWAYTTDIITLTTPSADAGTAATMKYVITSCNSHQGGVGDHVPYEGWDVARGHSPNGLIHLGDFAYLDFSHVPALAAGASGETTLRQHLRAQSRNWEVGRVQRSMSCHVQPDDHELDTSVMRGGVIPDADWEAGWDAICGNRRLHKWGNGNFGIEGMGTYWMTAKTLFIVLEGRSSRNNSPTDTPSTLTVSSATWAGGTATVTTSAVHNLGVGSIADISSASNANFNGHHRVLTVPTTTTYTFAMASDPGVDATSGNSIEDNQYWGDVAFTEGGTAQIAEVNTVIQNNPKPIIIICDNFPIGVMGPLTGGLSSNSEAVDYRTAWKTERDNLTATIRAKNPHSLIMFASGERHQMAVWDWTDTNSGEVYREYSCSPISGNGVPATDMDITETGNTVLFQGHGSGGVSSDTSGFALWTINEAAETVTVQAIDGLNGDVLFSSTHSASTVNLLTDHLVHLDLDEATGQLRRDSTPNGYDFTDVGSVPQTTGLIGNAAQMGAAGDALRITDAASGGLLQPQVGAIPTVNKDFAVSFWTKPGVLPAATKEIFNKWVSGSNGWRIIQNWTGGIITLTANGVNFNTGAGLLVAGSWVHVVVNFVHGVGIEIFKNSVQFGSTHVYTVQNVNNTSDLIIGNDNALSDEYLGDMDLVDIYGRRLSQADITRLYNSGNGLAYSQFGGGGGHHIIH